MAWSRRATKSFSSRAGPQDRLELTGVEHRDRYLRDRRWAHIGHGILGDLGLLEQESEEQHQALVPCLHCCRLVRLSKGAKKGLHVLPGDLGRIVGHTTDGEEVDHLPDAHQILVSGGGRAVQGAQRAVERAHELDRARGEPGRSGFSPGTVCLGRGQSPMLCAQTTMCQALHLGSDHMCAGQTVIMRALGSVG